MPRDGYVKYELSDYIAFEEKLIETFTSYIEKHKRIYLYGAGPTAAKVLKFLERYALSAKIDGFLVSSSQGNACSVNGLPVMALEELNNVAEIGVVLTLLEEYHEDVIRRLQDKGISDYLRLNSAAYNLMYWSNHRLTKELLDRYNQYKAAHSLARLDIHEWHNVLLICTDAIGDEILNIPFIRELRRNLPRDSKITIVVQPAVEKLMRLCSYVDNVLVYDAKEYAGIDAQDGIEKSRRYAEKYLCSALYDVVFLHGWFNVHVEYLFLAVFSTAKLRIGYSEHNMSHKTYCNTAFDAFLSFPVRSTAVMNEVERDLNLIPAVGGKIYSAALEFWTEEKDEIYARNFFEKYALKARKVVAIVPQAVDRARMWDGEKYAEVMDRIISKYTDVFFLLMGGNDAMKTCEKIFGMLPQQSILNICGKTSLGEVAELFKRCCLYIGCNTGLLHIAAAVKLPTIEIICHSEEGDPLEYSSPERYRAWGNESYVVRPKKALSGCGATCYAREAHCINQITVDEVFEVVDKFLNQC